MFTIRAFVGYFRKTMTEILTIAPFSSISESFNKILDNRDLAQSLPKKFDKSGKKGCPYSHRFQTNDNFLKTEALLSV